MASTGSTFDTDCVLMLHCDGADASTTFTDSSTSSTKTVTANANAQVDTAQSKFGGASALFDGSGDYLSIPDHADWDFGTGDFTIDFWARHNTNSTEDVYLDSGTGARFLCRRESTGFINISLQSSFNLVNVNPTINTGTWYHFAWTRNGTNLRFFLDGVQQGVTETNSSNISGAQEVRIGLRADGDGSMDGWMDEIRIVKGTAVWTADFTPPASAYTPPVAGGKKLALLGVG